MVTHSEVIRALIRSKSVLIEGPPGTGKTRFVQEIMTLMGVGDSNESSSTSRAIQNVDVGIDLKEPRMPFTLPDGTDEIAEVFGNNPRVEWLTFHESYTYEDFILGLRPQPYEGGTRLVPHAGTLLDLLVGLNGEGGDSSALLLIDELNRANTSRVFGEFMTFLDPNYRAEIEGAPSRTQIPMRPAALTYEADGLSEPIQTRDGHKVRLESNWVPPEKLFILATMNGVDKGALPLDSALLRRFTRFYFGPSRDALYLYLQDSEGDASKDQVIDLTVGIFEFLNLEIEKKLGRDYLLGQTLFFGVKRREVVSTLNLIESWDQAIYPQLLDRFGYDNSILHDLLNLGAPEPSHPLLGNLAKVSNPEAVVLLRELTRSV